VVPNALYQPICSIKVMARMLPLLTTTARSTSPSRRWLCFLLMMLHFPNVVTEAFKVPDEDIYCEHNSSQNEHDLDMVNEKVIKWVQGTEFQAKSWGWIH
jgi:hypothetical protein